MIEALNRRLPIGTRMALLAGALSAPAVIFGSLYWTKSESEISFSARERVGGAYLQAAWPSFLDALSGKAAASPDLRAAAARHDDDFGSAAQSQAVLGASADSALGAYRALITRIGDGSNLVLDPDLDSFYVMDAIVFKLPDAVMALEAFTAARAADPHGPDAHVRQILLEQALSAADGSFGAAFNASVDDRVDQALADRRAALANAAQAYLRVAQSADSASADPALQDAKAQLVQEIDAAWLASAAALDGLLARRIDRFQTERMNALLFSLALFGAALALAWAIAGGLTRRLRGLVSTMDSLLGGDLDASIPFINDQHETGRTAAAVQALKEALQQNRALELNPEQTRAAAEAERAGLMQALNRTVGQVINSAADGDFSHRVGGPLRSGAARPRRQCGPAARFLRRRDSPNRAGALRARAGRSFRSVRGAMAGTAWRAAIQRRRALASAAGRGAAGHRGLRQRSISNARNRPRCARSCAADGRPGRLLECDSRGDRGAIGHPECGGQQFGGGRA